MCYTEALAAAGWYTPMYVQSYQCIHRLVTSDV